MEVSKDFISIAKQTGEDISKIADQYGYLPIQNHQHLLHLGHDYLASKFSYQMDFDKTMTIPKEDMAIITGFGPTNSPTAGTLSVILKTIALQKETGVETEIIISNLGAYMSRNLDWEELDNTTNRFIDFIYSSGFDKTIGKVRSHIDKENIGVATFLNEHILSTEDFESNKEATEELYGAMGLLGDKFGIITDSSYTVADCIKPLFNPDYVKASPHNKEHVLVIAGIEEHYFPQLANIAIPRIIEKFGDKYISPKASVSALFTNLISGLYPYPKMSKSIPDSAVNIGDDLESVRRKIEFSDPQNDKVVFEMMTQASQWSSDKIRSVIEIYENRNKNELYWQEIKREYALHFIEIAKKWHNACERFPFAKKSI